jgi:hypothetical protein
LSARRALAARDRTPMLHGSLPVPELAAIRSAFDRGGELSAAAELCPLFPGARDDEAARECAWGRRGLETVTCQPAAGQAASGQVVPFPGALLESGGRCSKAGLASLARQPLISLLGVVVVLLTLA